MPCVFDNPDLDDHEQVVFCSDAAVGLRAIIAVHRTGLRHALGGTRILDYADEQAALRDVLRLSRAMTYKAAMADLPFGGAKAVVIADPADVSDDLLRAMGRAVDRMCGRFVTGEDVNVGIREVELMRQATRFMVGTEGADASQPAAYGVFSGIRAAVAHRLGRDDLAGVRVAVQGLGQVGSLVGRYLHDAGARLVVCDTRAAVVARAVEELDAVAVGVDDIYDQDVEVFAPCALGGVLTEETFGRVRAPIIAGAANNPLAAPELDAVLAERGVLFAPDFVINGGGLINNAMHLDSYDRESVFERCGRIYDTLLEVFRRAQDDGIATRAAAERIAEERMARRAPEQVAP